MFRNRFTSLLVIALTVIVLTTPASAQGWITQTVDSAGDLDGEVSMALDSNGRPHVSYYDATNQDLVYSYWNSSSWVRMVADGAGNTGRRSSLALDADGKPHISYYDASTAMVKYAYWDGANWQIRTVNGPVASECDTAIAVDSAGTHVAYFNYNTYRLIYSFWNGSTWTHTVIDGNAYQDSFVSMKLASSGKPCFAYGLLHYDGISRNAYYLKYAYWNGASFSTESITSTYNSGSYCSLALDGTDTPHVSYWQTRQTSYGYDYLCYAKRESAGWNVTNIAAWTGGASRTSSTSIAVDSAGKPAIAYRDCYDKTPVYSPFDGLFWQEENVDTTVSDYYSLAFTPDNEPRICYVDVTNKDVKYAYPAPPPLVPPVVSDQGAYSRGPNTLSAAWTRPEGYVEYQYAIGTSQTDLVVDWKSAGLAGSATESGLTLAPGTKYYWYVKATNAQGNSAIGQSDGIVASAAVTPGKARTLPTGIPVYLTNLVVTSRASDPAGVWLEDVDRTSAICLGGGITNPGWNGVTLGGCYNLVGMITWVDGIPMLSNSESWQQPSPGTIEPLGFTNDAAANDKRENLAYSGIDPTGLLVTVWGKVTRVDPAKQFFYIDDGSKLVDGAKAPDGTQETGLRVVCGNYGSGITVAPGDTVRVTGIRTIRKVPVTEQTIVNGEVRSVGEILYTPSIGIRSADDVWNYTQPSIPQG